MVMNPCSSGKVRGQSAAWAGWDNRAGRVIKASSNLGISLFMINSFSRTKGPDTATL